MPQLSLFDSLFPPSPAPRLPDAYGLVLSPEQARVRDAGAGHQVVVAGAGTGKTELLTQRVLKLLLEGASTAQDRSEVSPAELEGVVALTFTNKAAAEMRSRVYRSLVRRLRATEDADERARLTELRAHFSSRNRIWTFDSLGATLLRLFPEHSPLPRGSRQPTAGQERALVRALGRAFWAWAGTGDQSQTEQLFDFLEMFAMREGALFAIREAARRERADLERLANQPTFDEFSSELLALAAARCDALWSSHTARVESLTGLAPRHRALLLDAEAAKRPSKSGGFLIKSGFAAAFARELEGTVSAREQSDLAARLIEWREASDDLLERRGSLEWCDGAGKGDPAWEREWRGRNRVASLARFALWWQEAERALKNERGLADFGDITRAALEVLEQPEVRQTLRGEIEWLLVDEFQDTNPAQWRVVEGLRRHAPDQGNTLLVGDPKQAIYDFRGGDIRVFDRGRDALEREGALLSKLSISRRSAPPLVEWTNRAFASIFPGENAPREHFEAAHGPLSPVATAWQTPRAPGDEPGVFLLRPPSWRSPDAPQPVAKPSIESLRVEAAHALSSWLLELLADAQEWKEVAGAQDKERATGVSSADFDASAGSGTGVEDAPKRVSSESVGRMNADPHESLGLAARGDEPDASATGDLSSAHKTTKPPMPVADASGSSPLAANPGDFQAVGITARLRQSAFSSVSKAMANNEPAIAVLFGDNSVKGTFEAVLRARGVPFVSVRGRGFFRSDAVRWSVSLWRALLDGDDETALVGLLRSPLGGQSDVSLLERRVAQSRGETSWSPEDEFDRATARSLEARLQSWRALAGVSPVSLVMERVLQESEIAWFEARGEDAAQRSENWRKVLDLVREREDEGEGGLRALVDFFEAHADDDSEPLAPLPSGGGIQLMTVHSSKGLGFPCCVLAQLESSKRDSGDKTLLWGELNGQETAAFSFAREREDDATNNDKAAPPLAFELLKRAATARALAEWKRLFYVACTRAQSHLVLLETDANAPATSWHALARPALVGLKPLVPTASNVVATRDELSPKNAGTTGAVTAARTRSAFDLQAPAPLEREAAREVWFDDLWGAPADLPLAAERARVEGCLRAALGDVAALRQDVPFCVGGQALGQENEWVLGAWPWLAPLAEGNYLLAVSGATREVAHGRAGVMKRIALEAGLRIEECHALWPGEDGAVEAIKLA